MGQIVKGQVKCGLHIWLKGLQMELVSQRSVNGPDCWAHRGLGPKYKYRKLSREEEYRPLTKFTEDRPLTNFTAR